MVEYAIKKLFQKPQNLGIGSEDTRSKETLPNKIVTSRYTVLTFLPLNFFHQIKKGATFFFFITLILLFVPKISPYEPYSYMLGFFIVIGVSMIKDAMEDYKRHIDDDQLNNTKVKCLMGIEYENNSVELLVNQKPCMELQPGDFILIERNEEIFADVILLRSKGYHKDELRCTDHCFIQTSSLDGESNLKKRNAIDSPKSYECCKKVTKQISPSEEMLNSITEETTEARSESIDLTSPCFEHFFRNIISFDLKDTGDSFDDFECHLNIDGKLAIADSKNVILRGSKLKNTESCLCLVVGVGANTKLTKSLDKTKRTKSLFDKRMNFVLFIVLLVYTFMMICTIATGIMFVNANADVEYLNIDSLGSSIITIVFSNYILYIYLIPLSLYVMLEVARFIHTGFIKKDQLMKIDGVGSNCRNSNVIEDLGCIDYILTDKTGTITKNSMTLQQLHINGDTGLTTPETTFNELRDYFINENNKHLKLRLADVLESGSEHRNSLLLLLTMLICNSVEILNHKPESISQEEICFIESVTKSGFKLLERSEKYVIIKMIDKKVKIEILGMREFASQLQRMDVVMRINGKAYLLVKGSDQKLLSKTRDSQILKIINSSTDYRSLVMKYKELTRREEEEFLNALTVNFNTTEEDQSISMIDEQMIQERKEKESEAFDNLEQSAQYLGTAFIEDEMQDEVEETMKDLRAAGLKIWMVTGDKKETAIACARSSCLIEPDEFLALSGKEAIEHIEASIKEEEKSQRSTWSFYRSSANRTERTETNSVFEQKGLVIYRATPNQKGKIASLVVKSGRHTLGIGDGNNDIAMLKGSDVGIGVMGKEGTQAAMAGDFSVPQFRLLRNLLFVHGRYCLKRYTFTALNSYYKNILFIFAQFIYNLYAGASARPLYSSMIFNYYNLIFTSGIPFAISIFDKDVEQQRALQQPESYKNVRIYFDNLFVYSNILFAIFESILIFFGIKWCVENGISNGSGRITGYSTASLVFCIVVLFSVLLRQMRSVSYRVVYTDIAIGCSIFLNVICIVWLQELYTGSKYTILYLLETPYFYLVILTLCTLIYLSDVLFENINLYIEERIMKNK